MSFKIFTSSKKERINKSKYQFLNRFNEEMIFF